MTTYLLLIVVVLVANSVPAFAPPTWSILVWFSLSYDLKPWALVALGVLAATSGRAFLAWYSQHARRILPKNYVRNMERLGVRISQTRRGKVGVFALFFASPLSSAQLFVGAGLAALSLRLLIPAFALGRSITYSMYVGGASLAEKTSLGDIALSSLRAPWGIALQVVMIALVIAPGIYHWNGATAKNRTN